MDYKIILIILMSMMSVASGMDKQDTQEQLRDKERYQELKKTRELEKAKPKPNQSALMTGHKNPYTQEQKVVDQREYEQRLSELEKRLLEFERKLAIVPEKN